MLMQAIDSALVRLLHQYLFALFSLGDFVAVLEYATLHHVQGVSSTHSFVLRAPDRLADVVVLSARLPG